MTRAVRRASRSALRRSRRRRRRLARGEGRNRRRAARLQRRRQDHDAQRHRRSRAAERRHRSNGAARRSRGQPAYAIVAKGLALSPEGWRLFVSQTVEQNLRLGADRARRQVAHRGAVRARLRAVSAPRRAAPAARRHAVRRRAADAGARPRADERAAAADARRAEPRPCARAWSRRCTTRSTELHERGADVAARRAVDPARARHRRLRLRAADRPHRARRHSSGATNSPARFRAASDRCWRLAGR